MICIYTYISDVKSRGGGEIGKSVRFACGRFGVRISTTGVSFMGPCR